MNEKIENIIERKKEIIKKKKKAMAFLNINKYLTNLIIVSIAIFFASITISEINKNIAIAMSLILLTFNIIDFIKKISDKTISAFIKDYLKDIKNIKIVYYKSEMKNLYDENKKIQNEFEAELLHYLSVEELINKNKIEKEYDLAVVSIMYKNYLDK